MQTKKFLLILCIVISASFISISCNDDNDNGKITNPAPKEQWGETLKGDGEKLGAYPDLYVNYWCYTYDVEENPDVYLCIKGQFPYARYFSISLYNDQTGDAVGGIDDYDIVPDAGSVNPYSVTSAAKNYYTIYIVPASMSKEKRDKINSHNIRSFNGDIKHLALCVREYLGTTADGSRSDEYGGVEMPAITAYDINTMHEVPAPQRIPSNVDKVTGTGSTLKSDELKDVPFFRAPVSQYYPNYASCYLYGRTHLSADSLLMFSFIPTPMPKSVEENRTAKARYWSICLGSAANTRSYYSLYFGNANYEEGKKTTFIIALAQNPRLAEIQTEVEACNKRGAHLNLMVWDSKKLDIDNKPIGEYIVVMYRNILPDGNWEYSMATMLPTSYKDDEGEPIDKVTDPESQLAHRALGDYGPYGQKISNNDFFRLK